MELVGRWPYPDQEKYRRLHARRESWLYLRSWGVITDNQLILGLGIQPEVLSNNANLEGVAEDVLDAQELE
jgi:hypothetical protein